MDYKKVAGQIIDAVGGQDNIDSVAHCATRLRIMVRDKDKIDQDKADKIEAVKGSFYNSGQYQLILGTGVVNKVYDEVTKYELTESSKEEMKEKSSNDSNAFKRAIRTFGDVFVPIIPVLVATGLFMGLRGLFTQPQVLQIFGTVPEDISQNFLLWTQILTDTAFAFLPALVAWSTFRVFGGSPVIGIVLGLMLVNPALPNAYEVAAGNASPIIMFGFVPVVGYQGTVLPAFISAIIGATIEKKLRKVIPDAIDLLVTPFITLLVTSVLALFAIGPVFHSLEELVLQGIQFILSLPYGLSGIIIGAIQQVLVITGIHHIFNFLEVQLLANTGENVFNALITAATVGQVGACLAVGVKTKDAKIKQIAYPSALSASLGITEPAIFGINLRFIKPFVMGMIGGAVAGFFGSIFKLAGTGMSVTVLPGTLLYLNNIAKYVIMMAIGFGASFVLTYMFGYDDKMLEKK
ncbi:sucrose-specific PTS transporter subunit IIBC [uncultured Helcococcus sp.]|uniref:sucrose-specific PTS transporter subunit IIBC n=1 Tax=uncultured Helcococcus sp. TaxID=1072508 RepID=UPI0026346E3F|nr:sucrose-specific PTS transporter subunit IIBC [uncultured Helcococcus sp.]